MITISQYLRRPNPTVDSTYSRAGSNTANTKYPPLGGIRNWTEFSAAVLRPLYRSVLDQTANFPAPQTLSSFELEVHDEDSLEHILSKTIISEVSTALREAWRYCHRSWSEDYQCVDAGRGGRAKADNEDSQYRPDWAAVQSGCMNNAGTAYFNLCPGDTKLSSKWGSRFSNQEIIFNPSLTQIQFYCGELYNVRYGYVITQAELCVVRVSREDIGSGLAEGRPARLRACSSLQPADSSGRSSSLSSMSGISPTPSLSRQAPTSSSWQEEHPNTDYRPIEVKFIPWVQNDQKNLSVKEALFFLHMMAGAPRVDTKVQSDYWPFDSWVVLESGKYRHNTTGQVTEKRPPQGALIVGTTASAGPSAGPSGTRDQGALIVGSTVSASPSAGPTGTQDQGAPVVGSTVSASPSAGHSGTQDRDREGLSSGRGEKGKGKSKN